MTDVQVADAPRTVTLAVPDTDLQTDIIIEAFRRRQSAWLWSPPPP